MFISSTNRSDARKKHVSDYYLTPIDKIVEFLKKFNENEDIFSRNIHVLDCCAGGLNIWGEEQQLMSYPEALKQIGVSEQYIDTIDIREDSLAQVKGDYLHIDCKDKYDVIITNPPFSIARNIIEKALDDVKNNGFVIMLLRLNYFGGKLRKDMWDRQMPKYAFVHNRRMSFTKDGKTDSIEYMHCCFQKGYYPEFTQLKVI